MDIKCKVGLRIKKLRTTLKLSQDEVAGKCGLSNETISRVERGVQGATLDNYYNISKALGVPLKDLFEFDDEKKVIANKRLRELIELLKKRPQKDIEFIYSIIKSLLEYFEFKQNELK